MQTIYKSLTNFNNIYIAVVISDCTINYNNLLTQKKLQYCSTYCYYTKRFKIMYSQCTPSYKHCAIISHILHLHSSCKNVAIYYSHVIIYTLHSE